MSRLPRTLTPTLLGLLLATSCLGGSAGPAAPPGAKTLTDLAVNDEGQVLNRWVAWREDGDCDAWLQQLAETVGGIDPAAWQATPLFAVDEGDDWPGSRNAASGSGSLGDISETLSGYCMAEGILDPADVPQMEAALGRALAAGLGEPEQAGLTPVSFEDEYGHWAEGSFFAQTGVADFSGSCGPGSAGRSGTPAVRLAILDTSPTLGPLEAGRVDDGIDPAAFLAALPSTHGLSLAATARRLLCSDPADPATCPFTVATRQALPYIWASGQTLAWASTNGHSLGHGQVGTQLWLARALRRELLTWERNGGGAPLVINLSLGWLPDYTYPGGLTEIGRATRPDRRQAPGSAAVLDALRWAQCEGALVVVAAGNQTVGGDDSGPLLPAAWAGLPQSDLPSCTDVLPRGRVTSSTQDHEASPLLVAVGGVGSDGDPLAVSRPDSQPALVAMGQSHAVDVYGKSSSARTPPRSGTSFSAVVVASALAASWHRDPNLSAEDVFDAVYAEATQSPNDPTVSTHYRPSPNTAVTVDLCRGGQGSCCIQQRAPRAGFPDLPALPPLAALSEGASTEAPTPYGAWVLPQPRDNGCSFCVVDPMSGSLYLDLEREWTRGTLELTLAGTGVLQTYPIPGPLPAGPQTYGLTPGVAATKALIRLERQQTGFTIGTVIDLAVK